MELFTNFPQSFFFFLQCHSLTAVKVLLHSGNVQLKAMVPRCLFVQWRVVVVVGVCRVRADVYLCGCLLVREMTLCGCFFLFFFHIHALTERDTNNNRTATVLSAIKTREMQRAF